MTRTLDLLNSIGSKDIDDHVCHLAGRLRDGLVEQGVPIGIPRLGRQANMICVESRRGQAPATLQEYLKTVNVQAAVRRNAVRFSFHFYNSEGDVDSALNGCSSWLTRHWTTFGFEDVNQ